MLKDKEVFKVVKTIEQIIDTKANIIAKEQRVDKDDAKSIIYLTTVKLFKTSYNNKRSKPITFFLNFCLPKSKIEIIRQTSPLKLSYDSIEKGIYKKFSFTSLDCRTGDSEENDLYDLYTPYEDNTIDLFDTISYTRNILKKAKLTRRERKILTMYYGINKHNTEYKLKDIGNACDLSEERVRQIKVIGLNKIKSIIK